MARRYLAGPRQLAPGTIFEVARRHGIEIPPGRDKVQICCPIHEDHRPSAVLFGSSNTFYCHVCTTDGAWTAKKFAAELGVTWPLDGHARAIERPRPTPRGAPESTFTPEDAQRVFAAALEGARDNDRVDENRPALDYLDKRGLLAALEVGLVGILGSRMALPSQVDWWAWRCYEIVAPLYNAEGKLVIVQARSIIPQGKKTLFPKGSLAGGTMFANRPGLAMLRGDPSVPTRVILGEGMTDYLALSIVSPLPVISAPGTGGAAKCAGPWAQGREVWLALDNDGAGDKAVNPTAKALYRNGATDVYRIEWPRHANDACDALAAIGEVALGEFLEREVGV